MRTVITGGCGFLGRLIAERLIGRGDDVVLFDIAEPLNGLGDISDKVEIRLADITNYEIVKNLISGADAVVHLASMVRYVLNHFALTQNRLQITTNLQMRPVKRHLT